VPLAAAAMAITLGAVACSSASSEEAAVNQPAVHAVEASESSDRQATDYEVRVQILHVADMLTAGIVAQFPEKFS
jgi:hypothetical protein